MHATPFASQIGRYDVLAQLGRGAMGVVYQARDPQIDRLVAIKTILWMGEDDTHDYRQRFMQEAKAAGRLSHPGIVQVFDVGEDPASSAPFIVMEYVAGQSLNKLLGACPGAKLPVDRAIRIAEEIADALAYAHAQGVVHRDIKPANILVTEDGHAKIADFGVAKIDFSNLTIAGHAVGTPAYMAPEQLAGAHVDGRADLFSLGVILYSMVSGFRPFQGRGNSTIAHKVRHGEPLPVSTFEVHLPPAVDALLARAMAKDPADRFQSGAEMAAALRKLRGADPSSSSTDFRAVMQETGAHLACMAPEKSPKTVAAAQQAAAPTAQRAAVAKQVPSAKPVPAAMVSARVKSSPVTVSKSQIKNQKSKIYLAAVLATAMVAACTLAWRLHASMRPQVAPEPVAWETAPTTTAAQPDLAQPLQTQSGDATPAVVPPSAKPAVNAAASKLKPRPTDDTDVVPDRTIRLGKSAATASTDRTVRVAKSTPVSAPAKQIVSDTASLQLALEHSFDNAQVTVWVGDHQVLTESLRGEKKRVLMFQRTRGTFMNKVAVPTGQHLVRVRIQSADSFDATQSISADFAKSSEYVLHARCDKKRRSLALDLAPAAITSAN